VIAVIGRDGSRSAVAQIALKVPRAIGKGLAQDDREVFVVAVPVGAADGVEMLGL